MVGERGGGAMAVSLDVVALEKPEDVNVIVGQAHFIKTVEDLHEALTGTTVPVCDLIMAHAGEARSRVW
jgi:adenosine/AMP kinase